MVNSMAMGMAVDTTVLLIEIIANSRVATHLGILVRVHQITLRKIATSRRTLEHPPDVSRVHRAAFYLFGICLARGYFYGPCIRQQPSKARHKPLAANS